MKEKLFKIAKALLVTVSLLELALSQIHIEMITKLFTSHVGFYLFLFVISGMLVLFNLTSMTIDNSGKLKEFIMAIVVAAASGIYFVYVTWTDFITQESVMFEDIQLSVALICIGLVIYILGCISIVTSYSIHEKED